MSGSGPTSPPTAPRTLLAGFTARPGRAEEIGGLLAAYAEVVRAEPGCLAFSPHRLADQPSAFVVYEVYRDEEAFQAHLAGAAGVEFNARLAPLIVEEHSQLTWLRGL